MLNFNYKIDGKQILIFFIVKNFIFRFRCDDHCICEVSAEEVFKSEWFVEMKEIFFFVKIVLYF
jgi:hypothetical protein